MMIHAQDCLGIDVTQAAMPGVEVRFGRNDSCCESCNGSIRDVGRGLHVTIAVREIADFGSFGV